MNSCPKRCVTCVPRYFFTDEAKSNKVVYFLKAIKKISLFAF